MSLLRYQVVMGYVVAFVSIWIFALSRKDTLKESAANYGIPEDQIMLLVKWAPVIAIFCLGVYALSALIVGVIQFKDCPESATELEKQVEEAKRELKKRRIID